MICYDGYDVLKFVLGDSLEEDRPNDRPDNPRTLRYLIHCNDSHYDVDMVVAMLLKGDDFTLETLTFDQHEYEKTCELLMHHCAVRAVGDDIVQLATLCPMDYDNPTYVCGVLLQQEFEVPMKSLPLEALLVLVIVTPDKFDLSYWERLAEACSGASLLLNAPAGLVCVRMGEGAKELVVRPHE